MALVIRPRFGQPCFECGETVPKQRADQFRKRAEEMGKLTLKSDILCVDCGNRRLANGEALVEPRERF